MRQTLKAVLAASVLFAGLNGAAVSVSAAPAIADLAAAYNDNTDREFRQGLQMRLAWAGDYAGSFDGHIGPQTLRAIRDFQARNGLPSDGVMTEPFLQALLAASDTAVDAVGFIWESDGETGVRFGLPSTLVQRVGRTEVGTMWRASDASIEIETVRFANEGYDLREVFDILRTETASKTVRQADFIGDHFVIRGREDGRDYFIRFDGEGTDLRGFSVAYAPERGDELAPYIAVAAGSFEPFHAPAQDPNGALASISRDDRYAQAFASPNTLVARTAPADVRDDGSPAFDASGTGFVVAGEWVLTNAHVVNACATVLVGQVGAASEVVIDADNDLALLRLEGDLGAPLPLVEDTPRLGEDILALGYPLRSILADSLNVTRGNVSSLLGLMNDPNYLQISAAVQPGNSGGPVVDLAGRVVGIVTAKLDAVAVADLTGDIPQTINFAIRTDAAARFLDDQGVSYTPAPTDATFESVPDATAKVQDSILPIICLGERG
ncbi:serine protease [Aureimonas mangrovi]|uniref:serine protease n=1 Tax=Aureimonas mangrovi TaxID=2758041 RepID=UPI00163D6814|nr:serine protease [Aureimonas mangrovi]